MRIYSVEGRRCILNIKQSLSHLLNFSAHKNELNCIFGAGNLIMNYTHALLFLFPTYCPSTENQFTNASLRFWKRKKKKKEE